MTVNIWTKPKVSARKVTIEADVEEVARRASRFLELHCAAFLARLDIDDHRPRYEIEVSINGKKLDFELSEVTFPGFGCAYVLLSTLDRQYILGILKSDRTFQFIGYLVKFSDEDLADVHDEYEECAAVAHRLLRRA